MSKTGEWRDKISLWRNRIICRTMARPGDFNTETKRAAIARQGGICAFCGVCIETPWSDGDYSGHAHHLKPLLHGGTNKLDNCVYLCEAHHKLIGHGMASHGIDKQGGGSDAWVMLNADDFLYWQGK